MKSKYLYLLIAVALIGVFGTAQTVAADDEYDVSLLANYTLQKYTGAYSSVDGTYGGVDDLGRALTADTETTSVKTNRSVGIFYFLWQGEHGTAGPYDNTKTASVAGALSSEANWMAAGGGGQGAHHFWGEPLFGYYKSSDVWVIRKHVQMLTDAGIDYIAFDVTNGYAYIDRVKQVIAIWYEYMEAGHDVPQLTFYTNSSSGKVINELYNGIYNNAEMKAKYPKLDSLWFKWDGKPMVIGNYSDSALSSACKSFFRIKAAQWPNESYKADGFPWMEFDRYLTSSSIYGNNGNKEVMNVSIAQHNSTVQFSWTAWYGGNDRTRSWNGSSNSKATDASLFGYNFQLQWNYALKNDTQTVFITGWNEWVAQRQPAQSGRPIVFVDCADMNNSRDSEPMRGGYGDNYYMQIIDNLRAYKGTAPRVNIGNNTAINVKGDFSQWDSAAVTARYTDYAGDTADRLTSGFGSLIYKNTTGRNDIVAVKAAKDDTNIYFYAETAEDITPYTDFHWMSLFIKTDNTNPNWYDYNYAVNITTPKSATEAYLCKSNGGWDWTTVCTVSMKVEKNKIMLAIPRSAIGLSGTLTDIEFKWADNYQKGGDIWSFYEDGDTAPYGRLNYIFSDTKKVYASGTDITPPVVRDIQITEIDEKGYTVVMKVSDDVKLSTVYVPTWSDDGNWQDDLIWHAATINGTTATCRINYSEHNNYKGKYVSHIYADDAAGNRIFAGVRNIQYETVKPAITDIKITNVSGVGYTVTCSVSDASGIDRVLFPTWTDANGQDDMIWLEGIINGNKAFCNIKTSDFNGKTGKYSTHIYAYDACGNSTGAQTEGVTVANQKPAIGKVTVSNISASGYTVTCEVTDDIGISSVKFPTWTVNAGQDDIIWYEGTVNGNIASCRINASEHKNETGAYSTHIYVYDFLNESVTCAANVTVEDKKPFETTGDGSAVLKDGNVIITKTDVTVSSLKKLFLCNISVYDALGKEIPETDYASTGFIVKGIETSTQNAQAVAVVKGDIDCDGRITANDYVLLKMHFKAGISFGTQVILAADCNSNGVITTTDYLIIKHKALAK